MFACLTCILPFFIMELWFPPLPRYLPSFLAAKSLRETNLTPSSKSEPGLFQSSPYSGLIIGPGMGICTYLGQWNLRERFPRGFWGHFPFHKRELQEEIDFLNFQMCVWLWQLECHSCCAASLGMKPTVRRRSWMIERPWGSWWWYQSGESALAAVLPLAFFVVWDKKYMYPSC